MVGIPSEKKGVRFFNLPVGRSKTISDSQKKINLRMQPIFSAMSYRIFRFQQTDNLCATLFDVLLGGASPKQVDILIMLGEFLLILPSSAGYLIYRIWLFALITFRCCRNTAN